MAGAAEDDDVPLQIKAAAILWGSIWDQESMLELSKVRNLHIVGTVTVVWTETVWTRGPQEATERVRRNVWVQSRQLHWALQTEAREPVRPDACAETQGDFLGESEV